MQGGSNPPSQGPRFSDLDDPDSHLYPDTLSALPPSSHALPHPGAAAAQVYPSAAHPRPATPLAPVTATHIENSISIINIDVPSDPGSFISQSQGNSSIVLPQAHTANSSSSIIPSPIQLPHHHDLSFSSTDILPQNSSTPITSVHALHASSPATLPPASNLPTTAPVFPPPPMSMPVAPNYTHHDRNQSLPNSSSQQFDQVYTQKVSLNRSATTAHDPARYSYNGNFINIHGAPPQLPSAPMPNIDPATNFQYSMAQMQPPQIFIPSMDQQQQPSQSTDQILIPSEVSLQQPQQPQQFPQESQLQPQLIQIPQQPLYYPNSFDQPGVPLSPTNPNTIVIPEMSDGVTFAGIPGPDPFSPLSENFHQLHSPPQSQPNLPLDQQRVALASTGTPPKAPDPPHVYDLIHTSRHAHSASKNLSSSSNILSAKPSEPKNSSEYALHIIFTRVRLNLAFFFVFFQL